MVVVASCLQARTILIYYLDMEKRNVQHANLHVCVWGAASDPSDLARVAPALAQFAVHVGWTFSGDDFSTPYNPQAVINNYMPFANQGMTGIILMHSVYNATALALPSLIANAKQVSENFTRQ